MIKYSHQVVWAYGVTTVPERRATYFKESLHSLHIAGFKEPRLFVDGATSEMAKSYEQSYQLPVTARNPRVRTYGNWVLSMLELLIRNPKANRFALFQDDVLFCRNLWEYLTRTHMPEKSYLNLYSFWKNEDLCPAGHSGWYPSNQLGWGALGLVFDREGLLTLFNQKNMVERIVDPIRGYRNVDGAVSDAMKKVGYKEYVHSPSLVQHIGTVTATSKDRGPLPISKTFRGVDYDPTTLL